MPYQVLQDKNLPADAPAGGAPLLELDGSTIRMKAAAEDHFYIENMQNKKNVRINSRDYTHVSGDASGVQIKPNVSATGAAGICGLEVSPRFAADCAGASVVAIKADPVLKESTSGGNISGGIVAVQANLDFGTTSTRVIGGDVAAFEAFLMCPSGTTCSGIMSFLRVRGVNAVSWDALLNIDDENTGVTTAANPSAGTNDRWMPVYIGADKYYLRLYD